MRWLIQQVRNLIEMTFYPRRWIARFNESGQSRPVRAADLLYRR